MANPWLDDQKPDEGESSWLDLVSPPPAALPLPAVEEPPPATGPLTPQPHVPSPTPPALPLREMQAPAGLWVVGAHGGSGESTVAALSSEWSPAGHAWPVLPSGSAPCVLTARTNAAGLLAAQAALTQWASSTAGPSVRLVGLLLIADAPGKVPQPLVDLAALVSGGAPRVWDVPWVEQWRLGDPPLDGLPRALSKLVGQLRSLAASTPSPSTLHTTHQGAHR